MEEHLTGGCVCGQLTFKAEGEPKRVGLCHCLNCRKTSGSAFNAFAVFPSDRVTMSGERRAWKTDYFCPRCGSQVFCRENADEIELKLGAFDRTDLFMPTYETWTKRRESWLCTPDLIAYPENRGDVIS